MVCTGLSMMPYKPGILVRQETRASYSHGGELVGRDMARERRTMHHGPSLKQLRPPLPGSRTPQRLICWCSGSTEETSKMKQTMADLDAILGIEEEEEKKDEKDDAKPLLDPMVKEEVEKAAQDAASEGDLAERMTRVVETAVKLADGKAGNEELRERVENLIESLNDVKLAPSEDIKKMKESVFGSTGFWVTEVIPPNAPPTSVALDKVQNFGESNWITFRGNMRGDTAEVFSAVDEKMKETFGDKYVTFLTEEKDPDDMGEPRIVFKVYPKAETVDEPGSWEKLLLWGLVILSCVSTLQLGITANLFNLPKETLDYLARPDNYDPDVIAPGLETFDFSRFFATALPISGGVIMAQLFHEAGHKIYASLYEIYTSPPFFIPNSQLGVFGAITQLREPVRDRKALWDFSFSGIALGGGVSLALLIYGLVAGQDSSLAPDQLVPVPSALLNGSLLLGTIIKLATGGAQTVRDQLLLHPMTIAGYCGLVATSFNLLPVGRLDGGRLLLAAFGRDSLYAASIFVYAGLGLGVLGSALALPFGLFVLICQREFEDKYCDQVTPLDQRRSSITIGLIFVALLILLPVFPADFDTMGGMTL